MFYREVNRRKDKVTSCRKCVWECWGVSHLGYMMNIVRKYMQSDNFENTRNRYFEFPKISFAYEVVEK